MPVEVTKANVLVMGPTGTGKTMLVETIADYLDVPYVVFNSTVLSGTAYGGVKVERILYKLLEAADFNLRRAQFGIICIDEFDKLASSGDGRAHHADAAVQEELLKLVEGTIVDVPKRGELGQTEYYQFNTENVLFIAAGAFNGLEQLIAQRARRKDGHRRSARHAVLAGVQPQHVIDYGFIPEIVGRFPVLTSTNALTVDELMTILESPEHGLLAEYAALMDVQRLGDTRFEPAAIRRIAQEAADRGVGARGLRSIVEDVLLERMYSRRHLSDPPEPADAEEPFTIDERQAHATLGPRTSSDDLDLTPDAIVSALDARVHGHAAAKAVLARVSSRHYRYLRDARTASSNGMVLTPPGRALLLIDPVLHQRADLVRALADTWRVPLTMMSAEQLERSVSGHDGRSWLGGPVLDLVGEAGEDIALAERGIVFLDGADTALSRVTVDPRFGSASSHVMSLLKGEPVALRTARGDAITFATDGLLVVLGGDFVDSEGATAFERTISPAERFAPGAMLTTLRDGFGLPTELLLEVVVATLDLSASPAHLRAIVDDLAGTLVAKYEPLVVTGTSLAPRSGFLDELAEEALTARWSLSDIALRLESDVLERVKGSDGWT